MKVKRMHVKAIRIIITFYAPPSSFASFTRAPLSFRETVVVFVDLSLV